MGVYLVIKSCCASDAGVLNIYTALETMKPYKINFLKLPDTRRFGHDNSLLIYELLGDKAEKRAKYLIVETAKRLLYNDPTCCYLPPPFTLLSYWTIPATIEIITEDAKIIPYLLDIDNRLQLSEKEKYNNDLEISEMFNNFEKNLSDGNG